MIEFFAVLIAVFVLTVLILRKLIPVLKSRKIGQKIYDIGPRWHKGKEGTPIMGGVGFIIPSVLVLGVLAAVYAAMGRAAADTGGAHSRPCAYERAYRIF